MRRITVVIALLLSALVAAPAGAQNQNPIDEFIKAVQSPENQAYVAQFLKDPVAGQSDVMDPMGDFYHSSGNPPGFTPDHIDIMQGTALEVMPGDAPIFGATTDGMLWMPGNHHVELPDGMGMHTYSIDAPPHDGSQYDGGAYFFGMNLEAMPPPDPAGRCEYVVWINDVSSGGVWVNDPAFPQDPAGGTNMAFGIGLNPDGSAGTFTLDLRGSSFVPVVDYDIRGFITGSSVGIFVPRVAIPDLGGVNFYAFCVEEGFSFSPEDTGSDQTGLIALTPDDLGVVEIQLQTQKKSTTTTTEATTTTTEEVTTTFVTTPTTTEAPIEPGAVDLSGFEELTDEIDLESPDNTGFPWWVLIVGGLGLAVAGWIVANRGGGSPCDELLKAWKKAQAECDRATVEATKARNACDDAKADVEDVEDERKELCAEWPPACLPEGSDGAWIEDDQGNRVTSRDLHLRRQALGEVWSDYKSGKLSAEDVQRKWEDADTPEFRDDMRAKDAAAKEELQDIEIDLTTAREAAKKACEAAEKAEATAKTACDAAQAARRAYEECIAAALAGPAATGGGTDEGETGGGTSGGQPGVVTGGESGSRPDPCEGEPPRKYEPAGRPERISVAVDFAFIAQVEGMTERNVAAGEQMVTDLNALAHELDVVGDLISAREAGSDLGGGLTNLNAGNYVRGTGGIVKGGVGTYLAAQEGEFDIPTSLPTAIVETLEQITRMTSRITAAVTKWMDHNQVMRARVTYFIQTVTATPYTVWECEPGVGYVCKEKVWEISVGQLTRQRGRWFGNHLQVSELDRWRQKRAWERRSRNALNRITTDAKKLIEWQKAHQPGPCSQ